VIPRRKHPKPYVSAVDPGLTSSEALALAEGLEKWPGSYARVLVDGIPLKGGYRPFYPPPSNAAT